MEQINNEYNFMKYILRTYCNTNQSRKSQHECLVERVGNSVS